MKINDILDYGDIIKLRSGDILLTCSRKDNTNFIAYSKYNRKIGNSGFFYCNYFLSYFNKELRRIQSLDNNSAYDIVAILKINNVKNIHPLRYFYIYWKIVAGNSSADEIVYKIDKYLKLYNIKWDWEEKDTDKQRIFFIKPKLSYYAMKLLGEERYRCLNTVGSWLKLNN